MSTTIKIEIEVSSVEQSEILVAELSEIKFYAFEESENHLSAFIKEEDFTASLFNNILPGKIAYTKSLIEDTNWNAKWESGFEPIIVEDFVAIRAAFHKSLARVEHEIIITPKMSFGTGHHATTYLMLQQMQQLNFSGKTVLDFGTGTGILAIMAKKLGAGKILAIDHDEWSINNALENFLANECEEISLQQKDSLNNLNPFDIVLANINLNVIVSSVKQLVCISHSSSRLLLSGFLKPDEQTVITAFNAAGFIHVSTAERNGWIAMLLKKS